MPGKTEAAARRLVAELYRVTAGRPQAWRMVTGLRFDGDLSTALLEATKRDWILVDSMATGEETPHSICLTKAGLRAAAGSHHRP
jgi:hypothetical protein